MRHSAAQREDLIQRYEQGPAKLKSALAKIPLEALKWRPAEGKWSVHEVICHCADSETNAAARIRYLVAEEKPTILGYDQEHWAKVLDYHAAPLPPALATVEAVRANTVQLLRRLPEAVWSKSGSHTESGNFSGEDWLTMYAEHLEKHARQIERNLEAWRAEETKPK